MRSLIFAAAFSFFSWIFYAGCAALAGDLPEALITYADGDLFIGEIVEIKDGKTTIEVYHALFENYDVDVITLDSFSYMGGDTPSAGDYLAIPVEYAENGFRVVFSSESFGWLIAESDSLDPKTLTLYGANDTEMLKRMNEYINDGTYSRENRKKLLEGIKAEDNNSEDSEKSAADEIDEMAKNTQIVTPVPKAAEIKKRDGLMDKPYIKYPAITFVSMVISYFFSRRLSAKKR